MRRHLMAGVWTGFYGAGWGMGLLRWYCGLGHGKRGMFVQMVGTWQNYKGPTKNKGKGWGLEVHPANICKTQVCIIDLWILDNDSFGEFNTLINI